MRRARLWCCERSEIGRERSGARAGVDGSAGAGLFDDDAAQVGKCGFEAFPDPAGEDFAGGVFEAGDVVEVVVVELVVERAESGVEVGEVADPAQGWVDFAADVDFDSEGMAVQARAFVPGGHVGQLVGRFESEFFEDFHLVGCRCLRLFKFRRLHLER
jgi:hypothetical protein